MTDGWDGILDPDEEILWQGRPDGAIVFSVDRIIPFVFGLFFAGFALFWMIMAAQAGGFFWMFGLLHFGVGISFSIGPILWSAYRRRNSWYTLTNRRAFIATNLAIRGKSLDSYPITGSTILEIVDGPMPSLWFASRPKRSKHGTRNIKIGFERIAQARDVYRVMRDIQMKDRQKQAD
ncbi:aspartate carbamoyltransferase catalytic subunit [Shimia abyssi]|uniref:PH (Pleckstrin Homology) domain-containing protein n=1 Tax=Shimia abyssi TaxID=1662395 RepID=A0A2P8FH58_9RHOB|nr:aspartate carbamoyltransferase catalytic subunit [Shimia abyssi]PSL20990.1 hypothetical protein CLV88_102109 [Shimia abyssi]